MIQYTTYKTGNQEEILVVAVRGHLDNESSKSFFDCLQSMIEEGNTKLIIDFGEINYMSSLALGMLVRANSRMKKIGGDVKLARVEGFIADIVNTVGLNKLFHLYPTVREASASF